MDGRLDSLPRVATRTGADARGFASLVAAETPVIIRGLFDDWPALQAARRSPSALNAYLKAMDRGIPAPVMEAPANSGGRFIYGGGGGEFNFTKRSQSLSEALDRIERLAGQADAPFVAIQMLPISSQLPDFAAANVIAFMPPQIMPRLWIGGPVKTQTHNDNDHNLACVLAGRRRFVLFPPDQVNNLYVGPPDRPPPLSLVDAEQPDFSRFPRFRDALAAASVAFLEPGDALYLPKYWWHHVTSLEPYNAMVNYWWGDTATGLERANDAFLTALLAFGHLPAGERAYWKAMFDAHVFKASGDATAHMPEGGKGVLGAMTPAVRARLKRDLKQAYLKP